jgi:hypothetical protein
MITVRPPAYPPISLPLSLLFRSLPLVRLTTPLWRLSLGISPSLNELH